MRSCCFSDEPIEEYGEYCRDCKAWIPEGTNHTCVELVDTGCEMVEVCTRCRHRITKCIC